MKKRWCFIWFALILSSCGTTNAKKYIPLYKEGDSCKIYLSDEESFSISIAKLDYGQAEFVIKDPILVKYTTIRIEDRSAISSLLFNGVELELQTQGLLIFAFHYYLCENLEDGSSIVIKYNSPSTYYKTVSFDSTDYRNLEKEGENLCYSLGLSFYG